MTKRKTAGFVAGLFAFAAATAGTTLALTEMPKAEAFADSPFFVTEATYDTTGIEGWYGVPENVQGQDNFFALYGKADGTYAEMTSQTTPHEDGVRYYWQGANTWNQLNWRQDFGPDSGDDAILGWRAPFNGTVAFQGKVTMDKNENSDGIILKVHTRKSPTDPAKELYKQTYTESFTTYFSGEAFTVTSGQIYFFSIDQNVTSAYDGAKMFLKASFTKDETNPGTESTGGVLPQPDEHPEACIFNNYPNYTLGAKEEYFFAPKTQGENNAWILYGKADKTYFEMTTTGTDGNTWLGSAEGNGAYWRQEYYPGETDDIILAWRAPFNGTVKFTGKIFKESMAGSDGVRIKAYNRKSLNVDPEEIYNRAFTDVFTIYFNGCDINVVSGEIYYFAVDANGTKDHDKTNILLKAEFTKNDADPGEEASGGIVPELKGDPSCIFNEKPGYVLGGKEEYYAAPTEQGEDYRWVLYGKVDNLYSEMTPNPDHAIDGTGNHWKGASTWNQINWRQECGPDGGDDVIFAWRAPFNGTVKFTGKIFKSDMTGSDGVRIKSYNRKSLLVEPEEIYNETFTEAFTIYFNGCDVEVKSGEIYYFAIDQYKSSAFDTTHCWWKVEFTKDETNPGEEASKEIGAREIDYTGYFGTEQGENNWFYAQGTPEKYAFMEYGVNKNSGELCWNGVDDWHRISAANMAPGTKFGTMRIYVVPKDGMISIEGAIAKTSSGGDGMNVKIYFKGEAVFEHAFGADESSVALPKSLKYLEAKAGDLVVFYTDCGGNGSNAYDNATFACEIFTESETGEAVENPESFLSPVSKLELQGVNMPEHELDENEDYTDEETGCNGSVALGAGSALAIAAAALGCFAIGKRNGAKKTDRKNSGKGGKV